MLKAIIICAVLALTLTAVIVGYNRQEIKECYQWQKQAKQYPNFYLTDWQAKQCQRHNIIID